MPRTRTRTRTKIQRLHVLGLHMPCSTHLCMPQGLQMCTQLVCVRDALQSRRQWVVQEKLLQRMSMRVYEHACV